MSSGLVLQDSRVNWIDRLAGSAVILFSHAYIRKSAATPGRNGTTGWSQEARLVLAEAQPEGPLPPLPNAIAEGFLEVGGIRHEIIPLPFKRKVAARLYLRFTDGSELAISGTRPFVELLGTPIFLEEL